MGIYQWLKQLLSRRKVSLSRPELGKRAEREAALYLRRRGYELIAQDVRSFFGQIDLVFRKGRTVIFVEVKSRTGEEYGSPTESLGARQRKRLIRAGHGFLAKKGWTESEVRFDLVGVYFDKEGKMVRIEHIPDAF